MTTVGYGTSATHLFAVLIAYTGGKGDTFPVTPLGRLVASITFLSALCIIAFPIAILGNSFLEFYIASEERKRKRRRQRFAHLICQLLFKLIASLISDGCTNVDRNVKTI